MSQTFGISKNLFVFGLIVAVLAATVLSVGVITQLAVKGLDTSPITGSILINNGATYTNSNAVTLTLSATDTNSTVIAMRFSNNGVKWFTWVPYSTTWLWSTTNTEGNKTVYAIFRAADGVESPLYTASIILDTTAPTQAPNPTPILTITLTPTPVPTQTPKQAPTIVPQVTPTSTLKPTPKVPEFSSWTIPLLLTITVATAGLLAYHKKHKIKTT